MYSEEERAKFRDRFLRWQSGEKVYLAGLHKYADGKEDYENQNAAAGAYIGAIPFILEENNRNTENNKKIDEQIAKQNSYGWDNNIRSYSLNSPQWLVNNVNPAWNIIDANVFKIPFGVQDMSGATKDDNAFFKRHLGYLRDKESMPVTGIRFAGDYNDDGTLRLPDAEYTGLSKKAKDFIRKGIQNGKIKPKKDGSWTEVEERKAHWGKDTSHLGTYSIRENNGSGIYDIVDTYDFPWYNPILNRLSGKQIEVRDTIHGPNANPNFYNFKYSKNKGLPRYYLGTEDELNMGERKLLTSQQLSEVSKSTIHEQPVSNVDPVGEFIVNSVGATKGARIIGDILTKARLGRMADTYRLIRKFDHDKQLYTGKSLRKENIRFADKMARESFTLSRPENPLYWIMDPIVAGYSKLLSHPIIGPLIPF